MNNVYPFDGGRSLRRRFPKPPRRGREKFPLGIEGPARKNHENVTRFIILAAVLASLYAVCQQTRNRVSLVFADSPAALTEEQAREACAAAQEKCDEELKPGQETCVAEAVETCFRIYDRIPPQKFTKN